MAAGTLLAGVAMWASAHPVMRSAAVLVWLLAAAIGLVLNRGGTDADDTDGDGMRVGRAQEDAVVARPA